MAVEASCRTEQVAGTTHRVAATLRGQGAIRVDDRPLVGVCVQRPHNHEYLCILRLLTTQMPQAFSTAYLHMQEQAYTQRNVYLACHECMAILNIKGSEPCVLISSAGAGMCHTVDCVGCQIITWPMTLWRLLVQVNEHHLMHSQLPTTMTVNQVIS